MADDEEQYEEEGGEEEDEGEGGEGNEGGEEEQEAEEQEEQEEKENEEVEVENTPRRQSRSASRPRSPEEAGGRAKTEAELAMLAQKRKQDEEDEAKLAQYEEQRRMQREKEEEELRLLKEKLERRKAEREEEEKILAERRREEEERRRQEDEERKAKMEALKQKKEEDKRKRQEMLFAGLVGAVEIPQKRDKNQEKFDKFGNIVKAKAEMGLTKEQHQEQKRRALSEIIKAIDFTDTDIQVLKVKIKEMFQRICRLEGDKYDLEERRTRQEYDLKELNERQRQIARAKALKKGMNPDQIETGPHPPKVPVVSKYDRQIDRRSFKERRAIYNVTRAVPHFPNVPPMPQELVKEIKGEKTERTRSELNISQNVEADEAEETIAEEEEQEEEEE